MINKVFIEIFQKDLGASNKEKYHCKNIFIHSVFSTSICYGQERFGIVYNHAKTFNKIYLDHDIKHLKILLVDSILLCASNM